VSLVWPDPVQNMPHSGAFSVGREEVFVLIDRSVTHSTPLLLSGMGPDASTLLEAIGTPVLHGRSPTNIVRVVGR
jgi:hypothetical protein